MAKITLATLKSFVKKNSGKLFINVTSKFDSMTDCAQAAHDGFHEVVATESHIEHTMGVQGAWIVKGSRDYLSAFENETFVGIRVSNCCGSFTIATKK